MVNGSFEPVESDYFGKYCEITKKSIARIETQLFSGNNKCVCINDSSAVTDEEFVKLKATLHSIFYKLFPEKSSFEK